MAALRLINDAYMDSEEEEDQKDLPSPFSSSRNDEATESNANSLQITSMESLTQSTTAANKDETTEVGQSGDLKRPVGFPHCIDLTDPEQVRIPEETARPVSPDLEKKIAKLMEEQRTKKKTINEEIHKSKAFRNPSIYQKLIEFCQIDEFGTNFPAQDFDPARWTEASSVEELAKAQAVAMEKAGREKKPAKNDPNKRKTKWGDPADAKQPANLLALKMTGQAQVARIPSSGNLSKATK